MAIPKTQIALFNAYLDRWRNAYKICACDFVALKRINKHPQIVRMAITLLVAVKNKKIIHNKRFESKSLLMQREIIDFENNRHDFLSTLEEGLILLPDKTSLQFHDPAGSDIFGNFDAGYQALNTNSARQSTLKLTSNIDLAQEFMSLGGFDEINTEPSTHDEPHDGINDLFMALGFPNTVPQSPELHYNLTSVLTFNESVKKSKIEKGTAKITCLKSAKLKHKLVKIGVRYFGVNSKRQLINGDKIEWSKSKSGIETGTTTIKVGKAPSVLLFLSYDNHLFHRYWIVDSTKHLSSFFGLHSIIDPNSIQLKEMLSGSAPKKPQDMFEQGVASLLGLLCFNVVPYCLCNFTEDWIDLLAFTENGNALVVECTIGTPNNKDKLTKLLKRTQQIKDAWSASGHGHLHALPILVTALSASGIEPAISEAAKQGVVVVTKEDIDHMAVGQHIREAPSIIYSNLKDRLRNRT